MPANVKHSAYTGRTMWGENYSLELFHISWQFKPFVI